MCCFASLISMIIHRLTGSPPYFRPIGFIAHWNPRSLKFWLTGFLAPWLPRSLVLILHLCIALIWPPFFMALHFLTVLTRHPHPPRLKKTYSIEIDFTLIVVVFMDTASNKYLHCTKIFLTLSIAHSVPGQLNQPDCTLV